MEIFIFTTQFGQLDWVYADCIVRDLMLYTKLRRVPNVRSGDALALMPESQSKMTAKARPEGVGQDQMANSAQTRPGALIINLPVQIL